MDSTHIKRFRMKPGLEKWWLKNVPIEGEASWIHPKATRFISYRLDINGLEIDVDIGFPENLSEWDDFEYIIVMDDDFCQPYGPFYTKLDNPDWEGNDFLSILIEEYNNLLSNLPFLEEIKTEE